MLHQPEELVLDGGFRGFIISSAVCLRRRWLVNASSGYAGSNPAPVGNTSASAHRTRLPVPALLAERGAPGPGKSLW
jgi:hypothetical protein